jgi:hypothetical protein
MRLADLVKYTPQPVYINYQETPKKPKEKHNLLNHPTAVHLQG